MTRAALLASFVVLPRVALAQAAPVNTADRDFMTGMISHHAQAVLIAGWAGSHGANPSLTALCERIVVGQRDEIAAMQRWLRDRHLPVPAADGTMPDSSMPGMAMPSRAMPMMPGMLSPQQMAALDAARGRDFDRLFLQDMIQHHEGAILMVNTLLDTQGAANDDAVYRFASDVNADQSTEIHRMQLMLDAINSGGPHQ